MYVCPPTRGGYELEYVDEYEPTAQTAEVQISNQSNYNVEAIYRSQAVPTSGSHYRIEEFNNYLLYPFKDTGIFQAAPYSTFYIITFKGLYRLELNRGTSFSRNETILFSYCEPGQLMNSKTIRFEKDLQNIIILVNPDGSVQIVERK